MYRIRTALLAPLGVATLIALSAGSTPASAQLFGWFDPPRPTRVAPWAKPRAERYAPRKVMRTAARGDTRTETTAAKSDTNPAAAMVMPATPAPMVYAVVSLADQHISVYGHNGLVARSRISSGQAGYRTPTGIYGILEKNRFHESNIYDGAPMPFMQRLTWSGIALHEGVVPRYPASHGCIRLPAAFAAKLWDMTKTGARVVVSSRDVTPTDIDHPRLPVARLLTADLLGIPVEMAAPAASASMQTAPGVQLAAVEGGDVAPGPRRYNPIEAAALLKARANSEAAAARKTAEAGLSAARMAGEEARDAANDLRDAKGDLEVARRDGPAERVEYLERRVAELTTAEQERGQRALELALKVREAERTVESAREAASVAGRRHAPLSVLISGKEGLVIIKQGQRPVYEAPFTLRDPQIPLGTHLFVATSPFDDSGKLRWSQLTFTGELASNEDDDRKRTKKVGAEGMDPNLPPSTAREALDRIQLTPETEQKLAELIWIGGSIIVSDRSVGPEFGEHTDMVIAIP